MSRKAKKPQMQLVLFQVERHDPRPKEEDVVAWDFLGTKVRTVKIKDEIWWVLVDLCRILGIQKPHQAADRLEKDEGCLTSLIDSTGRRQESYVINEPGLYRLIFRSDKPEAKAFQDWVFQEVLPSIRKHGHYSLKRRGEIDPIKKEMRTKGFDRERAKARVESKTINKGEHKELSKNGAKPCDYAAYHNAVYRGAFNMDAKGLREKLGLKKGYRETPLDHMDVVALSITNLAKAIASKTCQALGIVDIPGKCKKLETISNQVASDSLRSLEYQTKREHVISIGPDRNLGKKIIAAVPLQLPRPA